MRHMAGFSLNRISVPYHSGEVPFTVFISHDHTGITHSAIPMRVRTPKTSGIMRRLPRRGRKAQAASAAMTHPAANHTAYLKNSTIHDHQG